jgi:starch synthase
MTEQESDSKGKETLSLRDENEALRQLLAQRLDRLDAAQRNAFLSKHEELKKRAEAVGEIIEGGWVVHESHQDVGEVDDEQISSDVVVGTDGGAEVVIESDKGALLFKFADTKGPSAEQDASFKQDGPFIKNARNSTSMAVPNDSRSQENDGSVTFTFVSDSTSEPKSQSETLKTKPQGNDAEAAEEDMVTDDFKRSTKSSVDTDSLELLTSKNVNKTSKAKTKRAATKKIDPDPQAEERRLATQEAESHDPVAVTSGKEHWLYLTVPETPVAGAKCAVYFNRAQSEVLRDRPRVQLHVRYNNWELSPENDQPERIDLSPVGSIPRGDGTDFWVVDINIPTEAYEMNFIFGDAEGCYDNNNTSNYCLAVKGIMSRDLWLEAAAERAEAAYRKKKAEEEAEAAREAAEREAAALESDKSTAAAIIEAIKKKGDEWRASGVEASSGSTASVCWQFGPAGAVPKPGGTVQLLYNRSAGQLSWLSVPDDDHLTLKLGHNGWQDPVELELQRHPGMAAKGEWWVTEITIPQTAVVLDFVINYHNNYDNNGGDDYHAKTQLPRVAANSLDTWADGLYESVLQQVTLERHNKEAQARSVQESRRLAREAAKAKAEEVRRRQMRHVLYMEPAEPRAGSPVTLYYNPNNTSLHGAERVFVSGGFNRWRHPKAFGPQELAANGDVYMKTTINVPKDAYSLDFVFSDAEEAGQGRYDNHGGLDYHVPVSNAVVSEPPLYVAHIAVEMAPICKVGGLGDVVTALGRAVASEGNVVEVILPRYDFFLQSPLLGGTRYETEFDWLDTKVFVTTCIVEGLRCWFLEPANRMFSGPVYKGSGDAERFAFFCRAALEFLIRTQRQPDILHCHDWSSAEVAKAYWTEYHWYGLWKPKVIFTIHNLNYGATAIGEAAYFSQRFTTVSPSYAWEIGEHPAVAPHSGKLLGIRNGIDVDIWNPETDQFLPVGYTVETVEEGKAAAREELRRRLGLTGWGDKPVVGVVTRLTKQKGTHLIAHACWRALDRGGQFVLLGSAPDPKIQAEFDDLASTYGGENAAFCFAFDEPLSHLIYAAADIILVPSMFEPCGLTQMIAMRYGAVPVVRATGGLRDTVFDVDHDKARAAWEMEGSTNWQADAVDATNGFSFEGTDPGALDYALNRALDAWYNDRPWFRSLQRRIMSQDWSWNKPGFDYLQLYHAAMK